MVLNWVVFSVNDLWCIEIGMCDKFFFVVIIIIGSVNMVNVRVDYSNLGVLKVGVGKCLV